MISRRAFFKMAAFLGLGSTAFPSAFRSSLLGLTTPDEKITTNIADALKYPRTAQSMPGRYPGKVTQVIHEHCVSGKKIDQPAVAEMVKKCLLDLTGEKDISAAWLQFVSASDRIGLKVNPVAGVELSTSHAIVHAVIDQLAVAGIPLKNIIIWDRREFDLKDTGFTTENFPGVRIMGTEQKDEKGSFYDADGKLYGERMIDKNWYYKANCSEKYDAETLPYMINEGEFSYFSKIVTQEVDKIINLPVLKNAGASVTLCMKNLAFGSITNTARLHKPLWSETSAEVCAFPPLRDKVVLNLIDGVRGCFNGGPEAVPQFITEFKTIIAGTDPVAVDRVGYDVIYKKRVEEGIQKEESPKGRKFMQLAADLGLGQADLDKITLIKSTIS